MGSVTRYGASNREGNTERGNERNDKGIKPEREGGERKNRVKHVERKMRGGESEED